MPHKLVVSLAVAALVFPLTSGKGVPPPSQGGDKEGQPMKKVREPFPVLPPVPTADPAVRSEKEFRVPSRLRVCRTGRYVGVEAVPGAEETVKVTVGKDMVTGLRYEVSVYRGGKLVLSGPGGMQSRPDATYAQIAATVGEVGSKDFQPGEKYKVKLRLTLFETDIPPQHGWAPETGRYKALWSKTLTLKVEVPADGLPVGRWKVEFANGVKEVCEVRKDRTASVAEPLRTSTGEAVVKDGSAVIVYQDDRVERWTAVGQRMIVEHWFPSARFPSGEPVLGFAEKEAGPMAWGPATEGLQMSIRLDKTQYPAGESILLRLAIRNAGKEEADLGMSASDLGSFDFDVRYVGGGMTQAGRMPLTKYGAKLLEDHKAAKNIAIRLKPGEQRDYQFPLNRMVDMSLSGTYSVAVHRCVPGQRQSKKPFALACNELPVEIREVLVSSR